MSKGLHEDKDTLFCNVCSVDVDKWIGTQVINEEVYCLRCNNWLCGEFDCFGELGRFNQLNNNKRIAIKLKEASMVLHDAKYSLNDTVDICKELKDRLLNILEDIVKKQSEIIDIMNETMEHLNNG